ncbi:MAG: DUF2140 family protein [Thermoflavifilum sp.]|nr:DUF2140 family protein [Thermoflavifilum sp.]MCL6514202.1 YpmS family protein [Alicyclobacillus sp.]
MLWKRAFLALLCLDLLVITGGLFMLGRMPHLGRETPPAATATGEPANVQISIGDQAINAYLDYTLSQQADVSKVLASARVSFDSDWRLELGLKMADRVVPVTFVLTPEVQSGDLLLHVKSADLGDVPVPVGLVFLLLSHLSWPAWISVDGQQDTLVLAFTKRPANPYGVRADGYSPDTKLLTLTVSIYPKALSSNRG